MIDEKNCCMDYLKQLFQIIRSFFYPSNTGRWSVRENYILVYSTLNN
jgi:hypothetical protein